MHAILSILILCSFLLAPFQVYASFDLLKAFGKSGKIEDFDNLFADYLRSRSDRYPTTPEWEILHTLAYTLRDDRNDREQYIHLLMTGPLRKDRASAIKRICRDLFHYNRFSRQPRVIEPEGLIRFREEIRVSIGSILCIVSADFRFVVDTKPLQKNTNNSSGRNAGNRCEKSELSQFFSKKLFELEELPNGSKISI